MSDNTRESLSDRLGKHLGIESEDDMQNYEVLPPGEGKQINIKGSEPDPSQDLEKLDEDYEFARKMIRDAVEKGSSSLEDILEMARENDDSKGYESASKMVKEIVDGSHKLMELVKTKREASGVSNKGPNSVTNNAVFVGSSKDLLTQILASEEDEEE